MTMFLAGLMLGCCVGWIVCRVKTERVLRELEGLTENLVKRLKDIGKESTIIGQTAKKNDRSSYERAAEDFSDSNYISVVRLPCNLCGIECFNKPSWTISGELGRLCEKCYSSRVAHADAERTK